MLTNDALSGNSEETTCYVCKYKIDFPQPKSIDDVLDCPQCGMTNILTRVGSTITPQRLSLYRKYRGDFYYHSIKGLFQELKDNFYFELENTITKRKKSGEIDEKEYKKLYGQLYRQHQKQIAELEIKEKADRAVVVAEEKAIKAQLRRKTKV
jgi:hypothetical protein